MGLCSFVKNTQTIMKTSLTLLTVLLCTAFSVAQKPATKPIIVADSTFGKEIIPFPIDWAPKLTLEGYEELTFFPNWSDSTNEEFWTLVMAWKINTTTTIPLYEVQFNINHYFYNLMIPNHWAQEFPAPLLSFSNTNTDKHVNNTGKLRVFDGFHTGKVIDLNLHMTQTLCKDQQTAIIICRISPKPFEHTIWKQLQAFKINPEQCQPN